MAVRLHAIIEFDFSFMQKYHWNTPKAVIKSLVSLQILITPTELCLKLFCFYQLYVLNYYSLGEAKSIRKQIYR